MNTGVLLCCFPLQICISIYFSGVAMSSDCDDFLDASEVMVEPGAVNSGGRPRPQLLNLSAELAMPQIALFPATPKTLSPANGKPEPVASRRSRLSHSAQSDAQRVWRRYLGRVG